MLARRGVENLASPRAKFERGSPHAPSPEGNTGNPGKDSPAEKERELVAIYLEITSTRHNEELLGVSSALWSILPGTRNSP